MSTERYHNEAEIPGGDASADVNTLLSIQSTSEGENQARGSISSGSDEDWIAVELSEGTLYTISVDGDGDAGLIDSVLWVRDATTAVLARNDDVDPENGQLHSEVQFVPTTGSGTQVYYLHVSGHHGYGLNHTGAYVVTVRETLNSSDTGPDITGTENSDKLVGTVAEETIMGLGGNDVLLGSHGDDVLDGGAGTDVLSGGPGADILRSGGGNDELRYTTSSSGVTVNLAENTAGGGEAEGDILEGSFSGTMPNLGHP